MKITDEMVERLGKYISDALKEDFRTVYLTGRLRDTITVRKAGNGSVEVHIPAEAYDVGKYKAEHVIVNRPDLGSYAELVNKTGGLSHKHVGYVERALDTAIWRWLKYYKIEAEVSNG